MMFLQYPRMYLGCLEMKGINKPFSLLSYYPFSKAYLQAILLQVIRVTALKAQLYLTWLT